MNSLLTIGKILRLLSIPENIFLRVNRRLQIRKERCLFLFLRTLDLNSIRSPYCPDLSCIWFLTPICGYATVLRTGTGVLSSIRHWLWDEFRSWGLLHRGVTLPLLKRVTGSLRYSFETGSEILFLFGSVRYLRGSVPRRYRLHAKMWRVYHTPLNFDSLTTF